MNPQPASAEQVEVRHCHGLAEFDTCIQLQRHVWAGADIDVVPLPLFVVAAETGGQVLGAFAGDRMVGFTLAVAGVRSGKAFLHSHMTAVLEGYRDRHIGRRLKLFQRDDALARGIDLVEWTFDPLEIKNAYFNLMRLGAIARRLLPNCYGITSSPLHGGLPTDRLVAEWWLLSPRVEKILAGTREGAGVARQTPLPFGGAAARGERLARIKVPARIVEIKQENPAKAARMQNEIREHFQSWFARGYAATGIEPAVDGASYLLEAWGGL
jgi:predicted GNAT superfamily acetyltransferase